MSGVATVPPAAFLDRPVAAGPGAARATATRIGLAVLVAGTAVIAVGAAGGPSYRVVPAGRHGLPGWVAGPLHGIGVTLAPRTLGIVFLVMCAAYVAVVASGATLPVRPTIAAIVGVHLVILVAPPLLSRDVFNYLEYGRVFALHGLDPYGHGAGVVPHDAAHPFICCLSSPDPYGPGFTLVAAALAKLSLPTGFWVMKTLLTGSALVAVALVWRCAQRLGRSPVAAAAYVGLNPVGVVFAAGGPHNDWLMMAVALAGVAVFLGRSEAGGAAVVVAATAVKVSALVVAPFMVAAADRRARTALAAAGACAAVVALLVVVFGHDAIPGFTRALTQQQNGEFLRSVPSVIASSGLPVGDVRAVLTAGLVLLTGWQLWRVTRGADWLTASGWTTLGVLASSSWLLPWYGVWLLPAAALSRDRSLRVAGLAATAYLIWARAPLVV